MPRRLVQQRMTLSDFEWLFHVSRSISAVCMYVCIKIYVRAAAYSLDCHEGAMINCRLYRTFQSLSVNRSETVTSSCRELSVVASSTVLGQSTRNFVVHSSWSCSN